jgi:hypothetical protein
MIQETYDKIEELRDDNCRLATELLKLKKEKEYIMAKEHKHEMSCKGVKAPAKGMKKEEHKKDGKKPHKGK